jgi:hypothetical protein
VYHIHLGWYLVHVAHLAAYLAVLPGARALGRLSSWRWAGAGCLSAVFVTLLGVPFVGMECGLAAVMLAQGSAFGWALLTLALFNTVLTAVFAVGSIEALGALRQPAVWNGFPTNED